MHRSACGGGGALPLHLNYLDGYTVGKIYFHAQRPCNRSSVPASLYPCGVCMLWLTAVVAFDCMREGQVAGVKVRSVRIEVGLACVLVGGTCMEVRLPCVDVRLPCVQRKVCGCGTCGGVCVCVRECAHHASVRASACVHVSACERACGYVGMRARACVLCVRACCVWEV